MKLHFGLLVLFAGCVTANFLYGRDMDITNYSHLSKQEFTREMILDEVSFKNATIKEVVRVLNVKLKKDEHFYFYRCAYVPDETTSKIRINFDGKKISLSFLIDHVLSGKIDYFYSKENQTLVFGYKVQTGE